METPSPIWQNGHFVPWDQATVHVLTHGLHYGSGVFEGIRAYQTDKGTAIFRLTDHIERFLYSASVLKMTLPYSAAQLIDATCELVRQIKLDACYIRPIAFYGADKLGIYPKTVPIEVAIAAFPWGKYLPADNLAVKTSRYIRIHPRSTVTDAKISGHYINSILALQEIINTDYSDVLLLDADGNVAEGSGANVFIVKDNALLTPPSETILPGLTRQTVFDLAKQYNITAKETVLTLDDMYNADEAFFCGTAAEITPFHRLDDRTISNGETGQLTSTIMSLYSDTVHGKLPEFSQYLTYV